MMIAICDSGGTKGDWVFIRDQEVHKLVAPGFNPYTHEISQYLETLQSLLHEISAEQVGHVHFYGAGCREEKQQENVRKGLARLFSKAEIEVRQDLLAAARATCGHSRGIACILGTGANSGLYDGSDFIDNIPTLGYLAGDEGSGAHFGKLLIKAYFYREMPENVRTAFDEFFPGKHEKILSHLYSKNTPNTFLASFMKFAVEHTGDPFIHKLLLKNFQDFLDTQVSKYDGYRDLSVHFVGSVAHYFTDILKECLERNGVHCGLILPRPMDSLIEFHRQGSHEDHP